MQKQQQQLFEQRHWSQKHPDDWTNSDITSRKNWMQQSKACRLALSSTHVYAVQTPLTLDFNNKKKHMEDPVPLSKLEEEAQQGQITKEQLAERDTLSYADNNFERIHNPKSRYIKDKRQTLFRQGWRDPLKALLEERNIDFYEWEAFIKPSPGVPDDLLPKESKEYLDYKRNVKKLFPDYYQGYKLS